MASVNSIEMKSSDRSGTLTKENNDESIADLDEKIKNLDFITMLISFVCFTVFAILYWTVLWM